MNWNLVNTQEYQLLMKVANDKKLMDQFYVIIMNHCNEHTKNRKSGFPIDFDECMFCMIYLNW